jgi:hypothetical protein
VQSVAVYDQRLHSDADCRCLARGDIEEAVEWAGKAAEQRFPAFIPRVIRAFEPMLRQSAAWLDVLQVMNLS